MEDLSPNLFAYTEYRLADLLFRPIPEPVNRGVEFFLTIIYTWYSDN